MTALLSCKKNQSIPEESDKNHALNPKNTASTSVVPGSNFRVVGYMPSWAGAVNQIQFSKLTHVNYAFILPNANGTLQGVPGPSKLTSLVSAGHAAGVKVLIAVGGWNDGNDSAFEALAQNASTRNTFVTALVNLVNQYGLDGVDIDWEYPENSTAGNFTLLMQQLSTAMHNNGKLLSAAVVASNGTSIQTAVFNVVDYLNLMAYDGGGANHSTYTFASNSITYWQGRGLSKAKTTLGVPFYGRSSSSYVDYKDILAQGGNPNSDTFGNVGYNGIPTIKSKTNLAYDEAGGIMIWDLNADATGANSLLTAIDQVVVQRVNAPSIPYGTIISLKGVNDRYVTTKNGASGMICTDLTVEDPERFTVIDAGGGKVALRSQGKYVSSENGTKAITCTRTTIGDWEKFDWIVNADGQVALRGNNGKFVSSENGTKAMTCTRDAADAWEYFRINQ
ncbi:hypothetical protein GS398_14740 [Pedobacter sp. HMF7056]|uniref:chitinase n=2 Tax=Hufsiella ginkgonis TaxID=2695274 RepID=A0A7K1Y0F5_9SPHI|nr:hypothetical protein [Hufsiella ginkgonis]